ncbi:hypothetical protein F53441_7137 [Fusarium austroafricanum]|uniref:Uncharacterized protein n=1 Tax=Fusarium austroafricanum TaxID=2364996 RepID=A0A8H4KG94_9HYPO|nr:hypothetical protein F53441_7137 [Fusarium austroafricanum]
MQMFPPGERRKAEQQTDESSGAGAEESQGTETNEVDNTKADERTDTKKRKTASVGKRKTAAPKAPTAQRRIINPPRRWTNDEMCQLLAHLEWSVKNEADFWSFGLPRFQGSVDRDITRNMTYSKLTTILRRYGPEETAATNVPHELLGAGMEILTLPEETYTRVNELIESLHETRSVKLTVPPEKLQRILQEDGLRDQHSTEMSTSAQNAIQADSSSQASPSLPPDDDQNPDNRSIRSTDERDTENTPRDDRSKTAELGRRIA